MGLPISVSARQGQPKSRKFINLGVLGFGTRFGVHNHSLSNVLRGLVERVFRVQGPQGLVPPPKPTEGSFQRLSGFRTRLLRHLGSCRPWTIEEFISSYRGAKQVAVRAAAESVSQRPVTKTDAKLSTFVKAEKLNLSKKPDPAPRVIQPRHPRYNVVVGPYLKSVEKRVYSAIGKVWGGPTVMKGYNAVDTARHLRDMWDSFPSPVGVGLDASRFDQHVSRSALEWEHSIYNACFRCPTLRRCLQWQIDNSGVAHTPEGVVKYSVDGCRMSGDMNTALGNCLLMSAMVHAYCEDRGVQARLGNNGDDCIVIMSKSDLAKFSNGLRDWFLQLGFNMTVEEPVYDFERIEFCQTRPVLACGRWIMCRDVRIVLDKDTVNLHPGNVNYGDWLTHVGEGGGALARGVPVLQTFYQTLRSLGSGRSRTLGYTGMDMMAAGLVCGLAPVDDDARISFYKAFGIAPWDQIALEQEIEARAGWITMGVISEGTQISCNNLLNIQDGW